MNCKVITAAAAVVFAASTAIFAVDPTNSNTSSPNKESNNSAQPSPRSESQSTAQQKESSREGKNEQSAAEGVVVLEENTVFLMAREPEQHLVRAMEQMEGNNPHAAAAELRLAGAYLKMQAARPGNEGKDILSQWEQRLDQLSREVRSGQAKNEEVTRAAGGANYALAKYFDDRARTELGESSQSGQSNQPGQHAQSAQQSQSDRQGQEANSQHHMGRTSRQIQAGYDLQAASDCFEQALVWHHLNHEMKGKDSARADQNKEPQGVTPSQAGKESQASGREQVGKQSPTSGKELGGNEAQAVAEGHQGKMSENHARHAQLAQEDMKAITEARSAAETLIAAEDLTSEQSGSAQQAGSRSSADSDNESRKTNENTSANSGNAAKPGEASASHANKSDCTGARQAADELGKAIEARSEAFKTTDNQKEAGSSKT